MREHSYALALISRWNENPVSRFYVSMLVDTSDGSQDAKKVMDDWLGTRESAAPMLILGGYGSGKTTFCHRLACDWANDWLNGDAPLPLLVDLRDVRTAGSLQAYLRVWCQENLASTSRDPLTEIDHGKHVLILDGLDEVYSGRNPRMTMRLLADIRALPLHHCRVALTARSHMFLRDDQIWGVPYFGGWVHASERDSLRDIFTVLQVCEFGSPQIDEYLALRRREGRSHARPSASDVLVDHTGFDGALGEISCRPLLLRMLADSGVRPRSHESLFEVYRRCMNTAISERAAKAAVPESVVTAECRKLARTLFQTGETAVRASELATWLDSGVGPGDLLIQRRGSYVSFSHLSIFEFYLAEAAIESLCSHQLGPLRAGFLPSQTQAFIAGWLRANWGLLDVTWLESTFRRAVGNRASRVQLYNILRLVDGANQSTLLANLLCLAFESRRDERLLCFVLRLAGYCRDERLGEQILRHIDDENEGIRYLAIEAAALHRLDESSKAVVRDCLSEKEHLRRIARWAARKIRGERMEVLALTLLNGGPDDVRCAAQILGMRRVASATIHLELARNRLDPGCRELTYIEDALSAIASTTPLPVHTDDADRLLKSAVEGDWQARHAAEIIGENLSIEMLPTLQSAYSISKHSITRDSVIDAIGELRTDHATDFLIMAYRGEEDENVRANIVWALSTSGDPRALAMILTATGDRSAQVRKWAEWARIRFVNTGSPDPLDAQINYPL